MKPVELLVAGLKRIKTELVVIIIMGNFLRCMFFDKTLSLNEHNVKGQIYASNEIDNIASYPNRDIVINEYQFIDENSKEQISLLEEGYVVDSREEKGYRKLENIWFVCVIEEKE